MLMQLLGRQYAEDYIQWTQLLSDKISAYNRMVDAINAAGDADDFSNAPYSSERAAFMEKYKVTPEEYVAKNNPLNKSLSQLHEESHFKQPDPVYNEAIAIIQYDKASKAEQKENSRLLKN